VKSATVLMPMMLPRISDRAAAQLLDILEQLLECVRHHYGPQIQRWHRSQCRAHQPRMASPSLFDDVPF
jgi:hypothetical protein